MPAGGAPPEPAEDQPTGPDPQGPPFDGAPPSGDPAPSWVPPTGHPSASVPEPAEASVDAGSTEYPAVPVQAEEKEESQDQSQTQPEVGEAAEAAGEEDDYERLLEDLQRLHAEREDFLDQLMRTRADFENYRKRVLRQQAENLERAGEELAVKLLEVLDVFDAAVTHGQGFDQAYSRLVAVLTKEGLTRIEPVGAAFDPNEADAVAHEPGDGGPVVSEVLRPGYRWKGRVVRPAMVKVEG